MGIYCFHCESTIRGGIIHFQNHLKDRRHAAPFLCNEGTCDKRSYLIKSSFIRHLRDNHEVHEEDASDESPASSQASSSQASSSQASSSQAPSSQGTRSAPSCQSSQPGQDDGAFGANSEEEERSSQSEDSDSNQSSDEQDSDLGNGLENSAARMILNLRKTGNVTETAMSKFIEETKKFMEHTATTNRDQIVANLRSAGVPEETIQKTADVPFINPFKKLKTNKQQMAYFEKHFNLVQPTPKLIGDRYDERLNRETGNHLPVQVPVQFQYISVKKTLCAILNNKVLFDLIHSEKPSTDGKMRSFLDGSLGKQHPLIKKYPNILRLVLYIDDFEVANPLGSKAGPHKITAVYLLIQNLPPEENSRLRSIHLLAYGYRDDLPLDRLVDVLLEPFFEELKSLETEEGVTIIVDKKDFCLRATLIALAADTLGAHEALGLHGSSAEHFCSHCLISKEELHKDMLAIGEMRSKVTHLVHLGEIETEGHLFVQREYAVKRHSLLVSEPNFTTFPGVFVKDGMHDILKGIAPMEIKLCLREHCVKKKLYTVQFFNNSLKSFNYGSPDSKNKPSPNISPESLTTSFSYNLRQSAAQTWCLLRIFPFLVASKVPADDPHLKLVVLLKRITEIIFSTAVSEDDLQNLSQLLKDHHNLFEALFPPPVREANQDNEVQSDEEFEDENFLEDDPEPTRATAAASQPAARKNKTPKKPRVVRPINKHHHLMHYPDMMRQAGPAVLYWCMRFEAKHAIAKKYGSICCNFKNLPLTLSKIHQINHTAELLDVTAVREQVSSSSKKSIRVAGETVHFEALHFRGLQAADVLQKVDEVTVGGFSYHAGLYVLLPMTTNGLPLFGLIKCIYLHNDNVFLITEDQQVSEYNTRFGAYRAHEQNDDCTVRSFSPNALSFKPLMAWAVDNESFLSPRCSLADVILDTNDED